jgi:spermidine/putrescine transport system permease protein
MAEIGNKAKERQVQAQAQALPFFFGAPVFLWQLLFFGFPLLFIVLLSVIDTKSGTLWPHKLFTLSHFYFFFKPAYGRIILRSLLFALLNAMVCLVLAYPLAYFLVFKARRFKNFFLFFLIVPFWTSFLLHVYAWFFVLERSGFLNTLLLSMGVISRPLHILDTLAAVAIMMVYSYFPFMALPLYTTFEKLDQRLIEASLDLGATWVQTLRKIMIPLTLPGILSGFFLVFVPSFAEFAIPELLGGDRKMFVGSVVTHYILGGATVAQGAAFTLVSSGVLILSAVLLYWSIKKLARVL